MELNERLAATRVRRLRSLPQQAALPGLEGIGEKAESRASRLAAKVAERYANAPSYSEVLAAEARARSQAAALKRSVSETAAHEPGPVKEVAAFPDWQIDNGNEDASGPGMDQAETSPDNCQEAEEERIIEPLAVNLIEFPRELVAQRKLRPRLAEGPLRESAGETLQDRSLLRAGEEPAESVSQSVSVGPAPANWAPIRLDETPVTAQEARSALVAQQIPLKTASVEDRVMATIFDLALIVAAFALFVLVFAACTAHPPTGKPALLGAGLVLVGFALLYHYFFFRYAEGTPGMRYAKIALCTFEDENPTRQAMCRRVLFLLLSAAPLGLGFLWACFDQDRLGWHDRISRMYQRSYS